MPELLISIFKISLVVIILFGMIMILLGINHLTHNDDSLNSDETAQYKHDLAEEKSVISTKSVFHNFLAKSMKRHTR